MKPGTSTCIKVWSLNHTLNVECNRRIADCTCVTCAQGCCIRGNGEHVLHAAAAMGAMDQISTCFLTIPRVPPHIPPPSPVLLSHSCSTTNRLAGDCPPSDPCPLVQATGLPCCRQLAIDVQGANLEAKVGWSAPALLITGKVAPNSQVLTLESLLWIVTSPMCFCLCECCWGKTEVAGLLQLQRQKGKGCHKRQHIASYLYSQNPCTSKKKKGFSIKGTHCKAFCPWTVPLPIFLWMCFCSSCGGHTKLFCLGPWLQYLWAKDSAWLLVIFL